MTDKNVIGLGGLLRSGKDTVADYLVEKYGYKKLFMSEPLLNMALVLDPYVPYRMFPDSKYGRDLPEPQWVRMSVLYKSLRYDYTALKENAEVRRFLQMLGTDVGRNMIDQNLWVNLAMDNIEKVVDAGGKVVITGMRFPNETHMIRQLNGETVWVERPSVRPADGLKHASEATLSSEDFDRVLLNHGTLEDLYWVVDKWMEN